ncbi:atlastin-2-like isoform X1 [Haemaphysalis longicornis]
MADHGNIGRPIQILRLEDGSHFSFDIDALREILLAGHVKNLPVVVVAIAGKFRKGKSFLMNFFLQYMRNRTQEEWMIDPNEPQQGFRWRSGSDRETKGIWIWSDVFVVTTTEGRKVAVLFLDSQGTFDCESTVKDCAKIFAFSAMASSVLIYNLQNNLDEADLQHLQLFTQYGRLAMEATEKTPFQKLLFLVRDWPCAYERPYGFEGGRSLLEQRLMVSEKQEPELQSVRRDIHSCFLELCCCLMPHPGKKVAATKSFAGLLSDIDDDFKEVLRVLVPSVLEPNTLVVKKHGDLEMTCQELLFYLVRQVEIFHKDTLPEPRSMFEATADTNNFMAVRRAIDHYRNGMKKELHGAKQYLDDKTLLEKHQQVEKSALELFDNVQNLGGVTHSMHYKDGLKKMISESFEFISQRNQAARTAANANASGAKAVAVATATGVAIMAATALTGGLPGAAVAVAALARGALSVAGAAGALYAKAVGGALATAVGWEAVKAAWEAATEESGETAAKEAGETAPSVDMGLPLTVTGGEHVSLSSVGDNGVRTEEKKRSGRQ